MIPIDILLDETGDLDIKDGDFVRGDATRQNQKLLLQADEGDIRSNPLQGVGAFNFIEDEGTTALTREIMKKYTRDGMKVQELTVGVDKSVYVKGIY